MSCDLLCLDLPVAERLRARRPDPAELERAAARAKALGDPTRLLVATALDAAGELCVCDLSWVAERPQALVSHHLRTLRAEGLVTSRRDGRMILYAMTEDGARLLSSMLAVAA